MKRDPVNQHEWTRVHVDRDEKGLLSETHALTLGHGRLYRTVIYQAPSSVAVALVFVPNEYDATQEV